MNIMDDTKITNRFVTELEEYFGVLLKSRFTPGKVELEIYAVFPNGIEVDLSDCENWQSLYERLREITKLE